MMEDWQLRVIDEQRELNEKILKLTKFLKTYDGEDKELLTDQLLYMNLYNSILNKRIENF